MQITAPLAGQIFSITTGLAVGMSGIMLMRQLPTTRIPSGAVVGASILSAVLTVTAATMLIKGARKG